MLDQEKNHVKLARELISLLKDTPNTSNMFADNVKDIIKKYKASLNMQNENGDTALHLITQTLVLSGARRLYLCDIVDISIPQRKQQITVIQRLIEREVMQVLRELSRESIMTSFSQTCTKYTTMASLLLDNGADVTIKNNNGMRPNEVLIECIKLRPQALTFISDELLQKMFATELGLHKIFPSVRHVHFIRNREMGLQQKRPEQTYNTLSLFECLEQGVDFNTPKDGKLFLVELIKSCSEKSTGTIHLTTRLLLSSGLVDINAVDKDRNSPLDMATQMQNKDLVILLSEHGAKSSKHINFLLGYVVCFCTAFCHMLNNSQKQPSSDITASTAEKMCKLQLD